MYASWKAAADQPEFVTAFLMCYNLLQALVPLEGRSVLQIICSLDAVGTLREAMFEAMISSATKAPMAKTARRPSGSL